MFKVRKGMMKVMLTAQGPGLHCTPPFIWLHQRC